ncbi:MAG: long-chain fatty acid--CoA ligase [Propionibacteriaceae bacterium]|nr:long-chain fatty acid--CoA ligase [Propionibacteriaceae bacterium]
MIDHLAVQLRHTIVEHRGRPATRIRTDKGWRVHSFEQFGRRIDQIAQGLLDRGIQPGDRIGLFAANCPEWSEIDFGATTVRAVPVPLYSTSTPEQIRHIAADSGLRIMVVGGRSEGERVLQVADELKELELIVAITPWQGMPETVIPLEELRATPDPEAIGRRLAAATPDDLASIIYTSGTTGDPKGVMLRHGAFLAQKRAIDQMFTFDGDDHSLCFLPLSHALERAWTAIILLKGCMNTYVPDARTVAQAMIDAKPTLLVSVPKLYEKVFATAHAKVASSKLKRAIFTWALRVGAKNQRAYRKGRRPALWWRAQLGLADRLVLSNIRAAIGGRKSVLACGGAPIRKEVEEFFSAVGQPIHTGYGLTEASPLVTFNSPGGFKIGTTGRVLDGGQLHIGEHGEVLFRGPNVMAGYWNDEEATRAAIDEDGWLHTGDAGYVDVDGFLVITDRIKDIIVTLGGKNVAPQPIEGMILADPLFEHAVLLGDNRPCLTLLVKPSLPQVEELGKLMQWPGEVADWVKSGELAEELRRRVADLTAKLPSQERPRATEVMDEDLTPDNGLLTPTLKVRRRQVEERFKELIDGMYEALERRRR